MSKSIDVADLSVEPRDVIRLRSFDPAFTSGLEHKRDAQEILATDLKSLARLQGVFFAKRRFALLLIFQGMDAAGKDGAIGHVMSGVNPQGVDVYSLKAPSERELSREYLWRCAKSYLNSGGLRFSIDRVEVINGNARTRKA